MSRHGATDDLNHSYRNFEGGGFNPFDSDSESESAIPARPEIFPTRPLEGDEATPPKVGASGGPSSERRYNFWTRFSGEEDGSLVKHPNMNGSSLYRVGSGRFVDQLMEKAVSLGESAVKTVEKLNEVGISQSQRFMMRNAPDEQKRDELLSSGVKVVAHSSVVDLNPRLPITEMEKDKHREGFREDRDLGNQSVQELESYAVSKSEKTTETVKNCVKLAEEIRDGASKTMVTLHQQGERITRSHMEAANIDYDLSRIEKAKQDDALSDLSNLLDEVKAMAIDMGSEIERAYATKIYILNINLIKHQQCEGSIISPDGSCQSTYVSIEKILNHNNKGIHFEILSNPEFLAEGTAIQDLLKPDRVLIGGWESPEGRKAVESLKDIYAQWVPEDQIITTNLWSAELSKLAANAFLAQRISSVNALSALCESTGADVSAVTNAVGKDTRIGPKFLNNSVGFGGSCFQKDILNLIYISECNGLAEVANYWKQVIRINDYQKSRFVNRVISSMFNTVCGKKIAILGFSFKKDTADTRDSPAIAVCNGLLRDNATISIYDPKVTEDQIRKDLSINKFHWDNPSHLRPKSPTAFKKVSVVWGAYEATRDAHGICILTEWDEFKNLDYTRIYEHMQKPAFVFDGRNVVDGQRLREIGFIVYSIGKPLDPWLKNMPALA